MTVLLLSVHEEQVETQSPNLGLHRIAHYLRRNGVGCDICEIGLEDAADCLLKAEEGRYALIGLSSTYVFLEKELAAMVPFKRAAERNNAFFCAGGQAPSRAAEFWLNLGFDGVIRGYGEQPMLALARALRRTHVTGKRSLVDVPALTWRDATGIHENAPPPLTSEIFREYNYILAKEMGIPATWMRRLDSEERYGGKESYRYRAFKAWRLFTSHKCPNRCGYCSSSNFLEQVYGKHCSSYGLTVDEVLDLIVFYNKEYGISFFNIHDDDFTSTKKFTEEFCNGIIKLKNNTILPEDTTFFCQSRVVDFLDAKTRMPDMKLLSLMKVSGFNRISFGVENFSKKMLRTPIMNKRGYDEVSIMSLLSAANSLGIESGVNFMVAVPEAEPQDIRLNLERLVDVQENNGIAVVNMFIQAYPGAYAFHNDLYPTYKCSYVSPLNGYEYSKEEYFIPHNPFVRSALEHYMNGGVRDAVEFYQKKFVGVSVQEMKMLNLIKALVMARHLHFGDLTKRLEGALQRRYAALKR